MERDSRVPEVEILLSTYNGERFLRTQLDSLFNQSYQYFRILVRDDGSRDGTVSIIEEYALNYPGRVIFFSEDSENLRPARSFLRLLDRSQADYVMFCDQDDYWLPEKIEKTLMKMKETERKNINFDDKICNSTEKNSEGKGVDNYDKNKLIDLEICSKPVLIHTDLKVVDSNLKEICNSFWEYQNINPHIKDYRRLTVENNVTGCTVMLNRTLADLVKGLEERVELDKIIMHDWFIAVVAAKLGVVEILPEGTILYRQHGKNDTGAKKWNFIQNFKKLSKVPELKLRIQKVITHSEPIGELLGDSTLVAFSQINEMEYLKRKIWVYGNGFMKSNFFKNLVYIGLI